ncbi:MAG: acyltransferase [Eubacterium sp.]|nr:acyltransferase [Eubacterium sp.]
MDTEKGKMREQWIDFLKTLAMIAVLQNHLPENAQLYNISYSVFSVSLFVLCGGVTSVISLADQTAFEYGTYIRKKAKQILFPYFVATCGYAIYDRGGVLDVFYMFDKLINFSYGSNGHMYYLVFYIELILAAPILVRLYKKYEKRELVQVSFLVFSAMLAYVFEKYTYLDKFALGSRFLFGGSYFFVFNLGIYIYLHIDLLNKLKVKAVVAVVSICALIYIVSEEWYLVWWSNPPSVKLIIYTGVVFLLNYSCFTLVQCFLENTNLEKAVKFVIGLLCAIGRYSLYIYLWHMMLLDMLIEQGLFIKPSMAFGEKIAISCFILYFLCLICIVYKKIKDIVCGYLI